MYLRPEQNGLTMPCSEIQKGKKWKNGQPVTSERIPSTILTK